MIGRGNWTPQEIDERIAKLTDLMGSEGVTGEWSVAIDREATQVHITRAHPRSEMDHLLGDAVDDIADVMEHLRDAQIYPEADRLRTICGRLARARSLVLADSNPNHLREVARTWR